MEFVAASEEPTTIAVSGTRCKSGAIAVGGTRKSGEPAEVEIRCEAVDAGRYQVAFNGPKETNYKRKARVSAPR